MSFMSPMMDEEDVTALERSLIGADTPGETMEILVIVFGLVLEEEEEEEEGFDMNGGLEPAAVVC